MLRKMGMITLCAMALACGDDDAGGTDTGPQPDAPRADAPAGCDVACDDGMYCNGVERCDPDSPDANADGCVNGPPPCPAAMCDEATDDCGGADCDADSDGALSVECGGDDCDDLDPGRFPANAEVCDEDGVDEDCDHTTFGDTDRDGDGFVDSTCCNGANCGGDCDDDDVTTNPSASEICDSTDNDCDTAVDEDAVPVEWYPDTDGDNFGDPEAEPTISCTVLAGHSTNPGDCDDEDSSVHPGAAEVRDMEDQDCDGAVDEGTIACNPTGEAEFEIPPVGSSVDSPGETRSEDGFDVCSAEGDEDHSFFVVAGDRRTLRFELTGAPAESVVSIIKECGPVECGGTDFYRSLGPGRYDAVVEIPGDPLVHTLRVTNVARPTGVTELPARDPISTEFTSGSESQIVSIDCDTRGGALITGIGSDIDAEEGPNGLAAYCDSLRFHARLGNIDEWSVTVGPGARTPAEGRYLVPAAFGPRETTLPDGGVSRCPDGSLVTGLHFGTRGFGRELAITGYRVNCATPSFTGNPAGPFSVVALRADAGEPIGEVPTRGGESLSCPTGSFVTEVAVAHSSISSPFTEVAIQCATLLVRVEEP